MLSTQTKQALGPLFEIANAIRLRLLKLKLAGNKVYCPCCKHSFDHFATFGNERRQNAWCPSCESLERHRLLWMYFENKTNLYSENIHLLHIAPETIFFHRFKEMKNINYYPADKFNKLYPFGTHYIDLLNINFQNSSFDAVICNHIFQYIDDDKTAMNEIFRVLKKGGWAIVQVPLNKNAEHTLEDPTVTDPKEREKIFGLSEHVRYYAAEDYIKRLQSVGFKVMVDDYTNSFSEDDIFKYGFFKGDAIYRVEKP